jgi:diguanylate cyclase (GGDEF)-like protein
MKRPARATPWAFVALAAVLSAAVAATGHLPEPWWRVAVLGAGSTTAVIGWRAIRLPVPFVVAMAAASTRLATMSTAEEESAAASLTWISVVLDITVGFALCTILAIAVRRRLGKMGRRDAIDVLAITIGASLVAWLIVVNPLIGEHGVDTGLAFAASAYLPISALILTFTIDLMFSGLTRNRTMQFVVGAALANLVATVVNCLRLVDTVPSGAREVSVVLYVAAFLLMCAGLTHDDAPESLRSRKDHADFGHDSKARLTVMTAGLIAPIASIAVIAPTSSVDAAIRVIGTLELVIAVVIRLSIAMQDHALAQQSLMQRVNRDDLTGLPTRTPFVECVTDLLEATWRSEQHPTIIQLNLDRFKNINDSLGHFDANQVLAAVAERLRVTTASFGGTVARSGGDDFVIVDGTTTSASEAMMRVENIREALAPPITVADSTVFVTASMGVAVTPRNRTLTAEELMRRADIATHRAKADGRNRVAVFDDSMQAHLARRMDVEHALHGAIGRQEMRLYHQPIVDIVTGRVSGFEALMRWQRSDGKLVSPADFIPVAEETGIICELGAWALHDALRELRGWIDAGVVAPTTTMSVNVSPRQIADANFADVVREALDRSGVSPHLLWIEMTESMMLEEPELAQGTLRLIRSMGVRLALDDFGTGFSSLSLLQKFPIQRIKIDRAFVRGIAEHSNDRSLVRTIIAMAQSMGLDLVAEGVETVQQLQSLRELGCDKAQGYLISHPVPADAMRSTMSALDELQSLSLFGPSDAMPAPALKSSGPMESDAEPVSQMAEHRAARHIQNSIGRPIGSMGSRPLGQPLL